MRMHLSPTTLSCSTVVDLSKQPWPIVTYLPIDVAAERPVGDVLHHSNISQSQDPTADMVTVTNEKSGDMSCEPQMSAIFGDLVKHSIEREKVSQSRVQSKICELQLLSGNLLEG